MKFKQELLGMIKEIQNSNIPNKIIFNFEEVENTFKLLESKIEQSPINIYIYNNIIKIDTNEKCVECYRKAEYKFNNQLKCWIHIQNKN